ncbi:MAG: hypothetical protein Alpg2KO_15060 [Alphaproteobacteria bacterium]
MIGTVKKFLSRRSAASTIAYALLVGLVGTVAITATTQIGSQTSEVLENTSVSMVGGQCVTVWGEPARHNQTISGFLQGDSPLGQNCSDVAVSGVCDGASEQISPEVPFENCDCPSGAAPSLRDGACRLISPPQTTAASFDVPELIDGEEVTVSRNQPISDGMQVWEADYMGQDGVPTMMNGQPRLVSVACDSGYVRSDQSCVAAAASASCSGDLPVNATPYSTTFAQTWDSDTSSYQPASLSYIYAEAPSTDCQWSCAGGYAVNSSTNASCHEQVVAGACTGLPQNAAASTPPTYDRTWTGTGYDQPETIAFSPAAATCGFTCLSGFILVGGACVAPEFSVTSYSTWSGPDSLTACLGEESQTRTITGCADQNGAVDVSNCAGLGTTLRTVSSAAGDVDCDPQPVDSLGGTQSCSAGSTVRSACSGFTCTNGKVLVGGACVDPVYSVTGYSTWSGADALDTCAGSEEQTRTITGCEDQLGSVDVSNCAGLGTLARTVSSPAGEVSCSPQPASSTGGTQSCSEGSTARSACSGFSCTGGTVLVNGACVSPVFSVTGYSNWSGADSLAVCGGSEEQTRTITGCEDQNGSVDVSNCAGLGTLARTISSPSGSVACSPQPANSTGGTQSCGSGSTSRSACSGYACVSGYSLSGGTCRADCPASTVSGYSVSGLTHGGSTAVTRTSASFGNGAARYDATANCADGVVSITSETLVVTACDADHYLQGGACVPVGTGFFSAAGSTTRTACSNGPANSGYTGSGGGSNNCGWSCNSGYSQVGQSCSSGCSAGTYDGYSVGALSHEGSAQVTRAASIANGTGYYEATANCSAGSMTVSGESLVVSGCDAGYYQSGNSCVAVGTGFYSPAGSTSQVACTNKPSSSNYTSPGGGTNTCGWACVTDFYQTSSTCSAVGVGYFSANNSNSRTACSNGPANSTYNSDGNGTNSCGWACASGFTQSGSSCSANCSSGSSGGYNYSALTHGASQAVTRTGSITGGSLSYSASASCNNGVVSISGESVDSTNCDPGYNASGNACVQSCGVDQYFNGSSCVAVGTGFYSPAANNSRTACSNKPNNSNYTSAGGGSNACGWACVTDFYKSGSSCAAVGVGYFSANNNNSRTACTNKPSNSAYTTDGNGANNCGWSCSSGHTQSGSSCFANCSSGSSGGYSYSALTHGANQSVTRSVSITGGTQSRSATASCSNGVVSIGGETIDSASCQAGYSRSGNTCIQACGVDQYFNGSSCVSVGTGYYSAANNNDRTACSNKPSNSNYTSAGSGSNACGWACVTDFYKSGSSCAAVGVGYFSANNNNSRTACTNKPGNSAYTTDGNGGNNCGWSCSSGYTQSGSSCFANCSSGSASGYSYPALNHGGSSVRTRTVSITGGSQTRSATASCSNGSVTMGSESISSTSCSAGYTKSGNSCSQSCGVDQYWSGSSCVSVGTGYYSASSNNSRTACSNKPSNSNYTSAGGGSNSCGWACVTDYYKSGSSCAAVGVGYYSTNNNNSRSSCTNKPSNSGYTSDGNGSNNCSWSCSSGYSQSGSSCFANCSSGSASGYSYPALNHGASSNRTRTVSITGGSQTRTATASCSNGSVSIGSESISSTSCNAGYSKSGNSCVQSCGTDQYFNGSSCVAVGTGYYSPASNNTRYSCSNKPSNSNYTSDGNGSNACGWACVTDRYKSGSSCAAVGTGYYSANNNNSRVACTNKPSGSNYTSDGNGSNNCSWACQTDRYLSGGSCAAVGTGYYSANNNNSRVACTNKPSGSNYTSDGNGSNACSWACQTDRYLSGGSCAAVGTGYYSPNNNNSRTACSNKPSNSSYTSDGNGSNSCGWSCASGYVKSGSSCVQACGTDQYWNGSSCSAVGTGYYSPASNNTRYACSNKPSNSNYTSDGNGSNSCGWGCTTDRYKSGSSCVAVGTGYYSPNSNNTRYACSTKPSGSNYTSDGNGSNNCSWACQTDRYKSGSSCPAVGTGYYSPNNNNSRIACTNKPSYSNYTSDGNGSNSCSWACTTDRYKSGSSCLAVGTGYYSPNNNNTRYSCSNKPSNSGYTSDGNGSNSCSWSCNSGYTQSGSSCVQNNPCTSGGPFQYTGCSCSGQQFLCEAFNIQFINRGSYCEVNRQGCVCAGRQSGGYFTECP